MPTETISEYDDPHPHGQLGTVSQYPGLERLMCAAVTDPALASQLLLQPVQALEVWGPILQFTAEERALVQAVGQSTDLYDFAARLQALVQAASRHSRSVSD